MVRDVGQMIETLRTAGGDSTDTELNVSAQYVRRILRTLRERGQVVQVGGRGRRTTYRPTDQ